jgi:hypothetical protein
MAARPAVTPLFIAMGNAGGWHVCGVCAQREGGGKGKGGAEGAKEGAMEEPVGHDAWRDDWMTCGQTACISCFRKVCKEGPSRCLMFPSKAMMRHPDGCR